MERTGPQPGYGGRESESWSQNESERALKLDKLQSR